MHLRRVLHHHLLQGQEVACHNGPKNRLRLPRRLLGVQLIAHVGVHDQSEHLKQAFPHNVRRAHHQVRRALLGFADNLLHLAQTLACCLPLLHELVHLAVVLCTHRLRQRREGRDVRGVGTHRQQGLVQPRQNRLQLLQTLRRPLVVHRPVHDGVPHALLALKRQTRRVPAEDPLDVDHRARQPLKLLRAHLREVVQLRVLQAYRHPPSVGPDGRGRRPPRRQCLDGQDAALHLAQRVRRVRGHRVERRCVGHAECVPACLGVVRGERDLPRHRNLPVVDVALHAPPHVPLLLVQVPLRHQRVVLPLLRVHQVQGKVAGSVLLVDAADAAQEGVAVAGGLVATLLARQQHMVLLHGVVPQREEGGRTCVGRGNHRSLLRPRPASGLAFFPLPRWVANEVQIL
eukprot:Rhum_TRINITY_DN16526_c0_g1::Rhum_TRINITY_DN16526_c0_g1_i1::g.163551::m.163551